MVEVKATEWAFDRTKEAFEQVAQDETGKLSIVQEIMTRFVEKIQLEATIQNIDQAKGLQSACSPQGLCENLVDALKLLANQQEDGEHRDKPW